MTELTETASKPAKEKGLFYYIGVGLSAGLLVFMLLVGALVIAVPAITGSLPLTVLTSSMEPKYPAGTLVVIKPLEARQIVVGDVITYQIESGKPAVVTHRVTAITTGGSGERTFTTKGDNNDIADPEQVREVQIKGKLWYSVPWIGYVANFINGDQRVWLIPAVAVVLFGYAGWMMASFILERKRKRDRERLRVAQEHQLAETEAAAALELARAEKAKRAQAPAGPSRFAPKSPPPASD
ncbi:MAG: signal peptidase I [Microbacteriaceae bacterium]